jgi:hypothetical protein
MAGVGVAVFALAHGHCEAQGSSASRLMVLVQPLGDRASIVMTYSGKESHSVARSRLLRLLQLTGGSVDAVAVSDAVMSGAPGSGRGGAPKAQTGLEATVRGMRFAVDRAFVLQPFLQALADTGTFEVLFLTQRLEGFNGIRDWRSDGVRIRLLQDGSPYRYHFQVSNQALAGVAVPIYEPPKPAAQPTRAGSNQRRGSVPWVWGTGVACGLVVFALMLQRGRVRASRLGHRRSARKGEVSDHA